MAINQPQWQAQNPRNRPDRGFDTNPSAPRWQERRDLIGALAGDEARRAEGLAWVFYCAGRFNPKPITNPCSQIWQSSWSASWSTNKS